MKCSLDLSNFLKEIYSLYNSIVFLYFFALFIQSAKTRPGVDCGSDHQLLTAKFRLKLKKVGKTTRLFRYDLRQTPYDYIVEVMNRLKGLDLVDRVRDRTIDRQR